MFPKVPLSFRILALGRLSFVADAALGRSSKNTGVLMFAHLAASLHTLGLTIETRLRREETGATAVEYGIMVALIAVVLIVGLTAFGGQLSGFFEGLGGKLGLTPAAPKAL